MPGRFLASPFVILTLLSAASAAAPPGKPRPLTPREEEVVADLRVERNRHADSLDFERVSEVVQRIADYRRQRQGARHWQAIDARLRAEEWQRLTKVPRRDRAAVLRARNWDSEGGEFLERGRPILAEKPLRQALQLREKVLGGEHPESSKSYNDLATCLLSQGKTSEALRLYRKALLIREKVLGTDHPDAAASLNNVGHCLHTQGRFAEALPLFRRALRVRVAALGEEHPDTASSLNSVACCLDELGRSSESLPFHVRALRVRESVFGAEHPTTANSYNNLALLLQSQGRPLEALPLFRRALSINRKARGEDHPATANSYNNLGYCLQALGELAEALPLFRLALTIHLGVFGKGHPATATSYQNLASCLDAQGKAAEALPLFRQSLRIYQQALGKEHPSTVVGYHNLACCLRSLGNSDEALPLFRQVVRIREISPGKDHPDTASSYNVLACCLHDRGDAAEALPLYRKALKIREAALGTGHPATATSYNNVAHCLSRQGKNAEAVPLLRRALQIQEKALGRDHPAATLSQNNLAHCLWKQKQYAEAVRLLQQSLPGQEAARFRRAGSGFERAQTTRDDSAHAALTVGLAALKQPQNAFRYAEASLARALRDDLAPVSQDELPRAAELRARLSGLEPLLTSFLAKGELSPERQASRDAARREYHRLWLELSDLLAANSARFVLPLERIQKSIPDDSALVLWVEGWGERWGCVLRPRGNPVWQRLAEGLDVGATFSLLANLTAPDSNPDERSRLLADVRKQWFDPLRPHLKGVKRLFVVPAGATAYIPADLLAEGYTVHYVPSGSMMARAAERHRQLGAGPLLAVGDPTFDRAPPAEPPASGLLVLTVLPDGFAAKAGLQPGDVLLDVGSRSLETFDDLTAALSSLPGNASAWRDGKRFTVRLQGSPLGAVFDRRSARAAVRAFRRDQATDQRGTGHKRLPGTRLEVESISSMVRESTTLIGSEASEQRLDALIDSGKLKSYRIVHLATHGETDELAPSRSAVILAQDRLPDPLAQVNARKHPYDGRLTVERIRRRWSLDADLVVLSACETGLGKYSDGDGLLGFAQAFLSRGARSVVLSRWRVDDAATALLMIRFYENLLGKRKGTKSMGRAASLDEAKGWLRTLPRKEAERLATLHGGGVLRGSEGTEKTPDKARPVALKGDRPFEHPYYWAAWTLLGDPD